MEKEDWRTDKGARSSDIISAQPPLFPLHCSLFILLLCKVYACLDASQR